MARQKGLISMSAPSVTCGIQNQGREGLLRRAGRRTDGGAITADEFKRTRENMAVCWLCQRWQNHPRSVQPLKHMFSRRLTGTLMGVIKNQLGRRLRSTWPASDSNYPSSSVPGRFGFRPQIVAHFRSPDSVPLTPLAAKDRFDTRSTGFPAAKLPERADQLRPISGWSMRYRRFPTMCSTQSPRFMSRR